MFDGPLQEAGETALHYSVRTADQTSLHLVDFLVQNRYILFFKELLNLLENAAACIQLGSGGVQRAVQLS